MVKKEDNKQKIGMRDDFSILIGGEAGQGIKRAGFILGKIFSKAGYKVFVRNEYPSLIRGGHNFSEVRISREEIFSSKDKIDWILALNRETLERHKKRLKERGIIIFDEQDIQEKQKKKHLRVPVREITEKAGGDKMAKNIILIAVLAKAIGIDRNILREVLKKDFGEKGEKNVKAAELAFLEGEKIFKEEKKRGRGNFLLTGNEAAALGLIKAGLTCYFSYPMTPATGILHFLAKNQKKFGIATVQLEDELAVANAAIGAAFSGAKTAVGTSGGGLALMSETLSLAAQSETPLVVVESQRSGPATGMPTATSQGDLFFALFAGQGDMIRIVAAPGEAEETFLLAGKILNLAWKYQVPSILLMDKQISESIFNFKENIFKKVTPEKFLMGEIKEGYKRYKNTKSGVSPLLFPGEKGVVVKATSYEHDEEGIATEEEGEGEKMQEKRLRKYKELKKAIDKEGAVKVYGNKKSEIALVIFGSTKGSAKEVAEKLKIRMVQPLFLEPFPEKEFKKAMKGVKKIITAETNALGQFSQILSFFGYKTNKMILKYNGQPFSADELEIKIRKEK